MHLNDFERLPSIPVHGWSWGFQATDPFRREGHAVPLAHGHPVGKAFPTVAQAEAFRPWPLRGCTGWKLGACVTLWMQLHLLEGLTEES